MNEKQATEILNNDGNSIRSDGRPDSLGWWISWKTGDKRITIDGEFTANELEAIAWWMKNKIG